MKIHQHLTSHQANYEKFVSVVSHAIARRRLKLLSVAKMTASRAPKKGSLHLFALLRVVPKSLQLRTCRVAQSNFLHL